MNHNHSKVKLKMFYLNIFYRLLRIYQKSLTQLIEQYLLVIINFLVHDTFKNIIKKIHV